MQSAAWELTHCYLDSSEKAQTAFWSEELEKAGKERMRTAWRPAAAPTKALTPPGPQVWVTALTKVTRADVELACIPRPGLRPQHRLLGLQ